MVKVGIIVMFRSVVVVGIIIILRCAVRSMFSCVVCIGPADKPVTRFNALYAVSF
jgi:hypothetical protein